MVQFGLVPPTTRSDATGTGDRVMLHVPNVKIP